MALLHKYLKLLRGKDCQLKALIDQTLYNKAFRRKAESLCNKAVSHHNQEHGVFAPGAAVGSPCYCHFPETPRWFLGHGPTGLEFSKSLAKIGWQVKFGECDKANLHQ
jgi:hypothetical protein